MDKTEMLYHQIYSSKRLDNDSYRLISNNHNQHYNLSQKIRFQMILIVLFYCFFTFCITYANTQETNYYYRDGMLLFIVFLDFFQLYVIIIFDFKYK